MNPLAIHSLLQFPLTSWCNGLLTLPKEILEYAGILYLVPQGTRLLQYLQVKTLIGCSDHVIFLLFKVPIK